MPVRIPQRPLLPVSVLVFLFILMTVPITIIALERYNSFLLTFVLYVEFLLVIASVIYFLTGRRRRSDYGPKYSFNSEGILVNKHLVFPWTEVKAVYFSKLTERFALTHLSTGNNRVSMRALGMVPSRGGELIPVYRTYSYGNIEVFSHIGGRPSVVIRCRPSLSKARRLFRKMENYSASLNPDINFHLNSR